MSYWISLQENDGKTLHTGHAIQEGGTQVMGGTDEAELNVTYNYAKHFRFEELDGLTARAAEPILLQAIGKLNNKTDPDYWKPTEGNVKKALNILLSFAQYAADNSVEAKFNVD